MRRTPTQRGPIARRPRVAVASRTNGRASTTAAQSERQLREARQAAAAAGLVYLTDDRPGIRRVARGQGFSYIKPDGRPVSDSQTLGRIRSLAIPPAYQHVWIAPLAHAHLQATGRDARGRKQYRYHPRWREVRDQTKYDRLIDFAAALPRIRAQSRRDLRRRGLPREKVLAAVVQLLEKTLIRVGNDEYARANGSFGLTTMRNYHVRVRPFAMTFRFRGKHGKVHEVSLDDPRLARVVAACQDLPGQELFQYVGDDDAVHDVGSSDINAYLREITGQEFTAKDFRTWAGTVLAAEALQELAGFRSQAQMKRNIVAAVERVAQRLGNTAAICRRCYVHPVILDAYMDRGLAQTIRQRAADLTGRRGGLRAEEASVLALLRRRPGGRGRTRAAA